LTEQFTSEAAILQKLLQKKRIFRGCGLDEMRFLGHIIEMIAEKAYND